MVIKVLQDLQVKQDHMEVQLDLKVIQEYKVKLDLKAIKVKLVLKEIREKLVLKETKVKLVLKAIKV